MPNVTEDGELAMQGYTESALIKTKPPAFSRLALAVIAVIAGALAVSVTLNMHQNKAIIAGIRRSLIGEIPIPPFDVYQNIKANTAHAPGFWVPPSKREEMGRMLESMGGFKVGVELGVQRGEYAHLMLSDWKSCEKYFLVDLWKHQENYHDFANFADGEQENIFKAAQDRLAPFKDKTVFVRNYTTKAAPFIPDHLDFIYVDARHDYCGAMEDMNTYWPKLRPGGIMAGHDYTSSSAAFGATGQNWSLCGDGSVNHGAVQGAVDDFAMKHGLFVAVTYAENHIWKSWMFRKPHGHTLHAGGALGK